MVGEPSHRSRVFAVLITAGHIQAENFAAFDGVVKKQFVKVAHAKEKQCVAACFFRFMVLPHHWSHVANRTAQSVPGKVASGQGKKGKFVFRAVVPVEQALPCEIRL